MSRKMAIAAATATMAVVGAVSAPDPAAAAVQEVGIALSRTAVSCPDSCQAIGRVTGFQVRSGSSREPYRVPARGRVVAFSIALGKPRPDQVQFFTRLFGGTPRARLSVLRPAGTPRDRLTHRLVARSEPFELGRFLGSTPTFALATPLRVDRGSVLALTVPTWAPAFAVGVSSDEEWRASRMPGRCNEVRQPAVHEGVGTLRSYRCMYQTARLMYTATFVPDPAPTAAPAPAPRPAPPRAPTRR